MIEIIINIYAKVSTDENRSRPLLYFIAQQLQDQIGVVGVCDWYCNDDQYFTDGGINTYTPKLTIDLLIFLSFSVAAVPII